MKSYKNIFGKTINVHTKPLKDGQVIKLNNVDQEIKNLVLCKYLKEVSLSKISPSSQNPSIGRLK